MGSRPFLQGGGPAAVYCSVLITAPRAVLGLVLLLCLGLVGPAPGASAVTSRSAEVATTTSVALTTARPESISVAISVTTADGSGSNGLVDVVIREVGGTFEGDYGQFPVQGQTVRANFSVPRQGTYEVEARYAPYDSAAYAASVGTSTITLTDVPPDLFLAANDIGNGVLEVAASVTAFGGERVEDGSFVFRLAGRAPITLANRRGGVVYAHFERLPLGRSYTVDVQFRPAAGSDVQGVTGQDTARLTEKRHMSYIGATGTSPRRGVVRIAAFMIETYPKGLVGKVAIRDQRTGDVVARIATMRYADVVPGVVRTITGVRRGVHRYVLTFTPARQFRATTQSSTSKPLKIDVR